MAETEEDTIVPKFPLMQWGLGLRFEPGGTYTIIMNYLVNPPFYLFSFLTYFSLVRPSNICDFTAPRSFLYWDRETEERYHSTRDALSAMPLPCDTRTQTWVKESWQGRNPDLWNSGTWKNSFLTCFSFCILKTMWEKSDTIKYASIE